MSSYFAKELSDMPIWVNGHPLKFSCLKTDDQWLINELRNAIKQRIGGVYELKDESEYQECVKKNKEEKLRSNFRSSEILPAHLSQQPHQFRNQDVRVAVAGNSVPAQEMPDPLTVPDPKTFIMPTIGKLPA